MTQVHGTLNVCLVREMEKWENRKELIFPLRGPSKGNWKKIYKDQGQQAQNPNTHTQNVSGLSGSKRTGKLDFSDKDEKRPHKKLRDTTPHKCKQHF